MFLHALRLGWVAFSSHSGLRPRDEPDEFFHATSKLNQDQPSGGVLPMVAFEELGKSGSESNGHSGRHTHLQEAQLQCNEAQLWCNEG